MTQNNKTPQKTNNLPFKKVYHRCQYCNKKKIEIESIVENVYERRAWISRTFFSLILILSSKQTIISLSVCFISGDYASKYLSKYFLADYEYKCSSSVMDNGNEPRLSACYLRLKPWTGPREHIFCLYTFSIILATRQY